MIKTNPNAKVMRVAQWRLLFGVFASVATTLCLVLLFNVLSGNSVYQLGLGQLAIVLGMTIVSVWFLVGFVLSKMADLAFEKQDMIRQINSSLKARVFERTAELESTTKELEKSLRVKSEFLATMSHEIRTPMNGVLGMSQLLNETELTERQRRYVSIVNASGKSLLDVLNNVLDFSKIEAGKMEVEHIPFDLENLVDECLSVFSLKALEKKVILFGGLSSDTPRICRGDPTRIRQVLMNLLSNAVKFTFNGEVSLTVRSQSHSNDTTKMRLFFDVSDQGIGIAQSQQTTLFEAFSQTDIATARKYGGTGLGLVICKQLLQLMDGDISLQSQLEKGSTFTVTIDMEVLAPETAAAYRDEEAPLSTAHVLLVDAPYPREQLRQQLRRWDIVVLEAGSYKEALALIKTDAGQRINQIISAASIKGGSGIDLLFEAAEILGASSHQSMLLAPISLESIEPPDGIFRILERPVTSKSLYEAVAAALETAPKTMLVNDKRVGREKFSDIKALVAEDNQVNQLVITGILKKFDISPVIVEDGADALKLISDDESSFDLILMDCEMPVMDGWEATEQIRQLEKNHDVDSPVKIVALSAHVIAEPKAKALASGMDRFVAKPVNIDSVEEILHEYFPRPIKQDPDSSKSVH